MRSENFQAFKPHPSLTPKRTWQLVPVHEKSVESLYNDMGIPKAIARLLVQKGIHTTKEAKKFFYPELHHLHDPFKMKDMGLAIGRIMEAMRKKERIMLYGDYDVDGTTSVALAYSFFTSFYDHIEYYIPSRGEEGYGISRKGVETAIDKGASLMLVMDCGTQSIVEIAHAKTLGLDIIVCDHHVPGEVLPAAFAMINPLQPNCTYPYKHLSGCGLTYKLLHALCLEANISTTYIDRHLDLVAISIACDIVPMDGENRILAYWGLQQLQNTTKPGLFALLESSGLQGFLTVKDIVFGIGPLINAAGRISNGSEAVKLLLATDRTQATEMVHLIEQMNTNRKILDKQATKEAAAAFERMPNCTYKKTIVLASTTWHRGIIGIVAARLANSYQRPTVILTKGNDNEWIGSGRSAAGYDLFEGLTQCKDLLISYGGHTQAAGLAIKKENIPAFSEKLESWMRSQNANHALEQSWEIQSTLQVSEIDDTLWEWLQRFAPFGPNNQNPMFIAEGVHDDGVGKKINANHLSLRICGAGASIKGMAFQQSGAWPLVKDRGIIDICFKLEKNNWQGKEDLRLSIRDIRKHEAIE